MIDLKKKIFSIRFFLLLFFSCCVYQGSAQDVDARSPIPVPHSRQEKKALKKKEKNKALLEKAIVKGRKRHEKIQTKDVRKRMKKSRHKADQTNAHRKGFFLTRWFTKKHHTTSR